MKSKLNDSKTGGRTERSDGSIQRIVSLRVDKSSCIGAWEIICDACPLKPHLEALGMKPKACLLGVQTNIQGAIPMSQCEHYERDSMKSEGKALTITCLKANGKVSDGGG